MFQFNNHRTNKRKFWGVRPTVRKILQGGNKDSFLNLTQWSLITKNKR